MSQQRAVRTRADLLAGAATEFARHGYVASSVNGILDNTACTKGSMYFHFASKREMAEAVLDYAAALYAAIAERWSTTDGIDSLVAIRAMVDDAAQAFTEEVSLRAEVRLSVEPEFSARRPLSVWNGAVLVLASRAAESGWLREGFTAEKFVRVLAAPLAGHRLLAHIVPAGVAVAIRSGYRESLETVLAAATTTNADARSR
ncbi:TetR/AcrR family transcriptional regulator [Rhodococcus sp. H29-C3]|uniref:TetR/AcrR family transcriptional regulator n=1 Tax=Rhodococcus sp. H29-C3 TaxID=3046307 RepID=UPI0024BBB159|nr:TetR/AcrR family transcriptional regulator [Rhodococcus sp. H29-C3]MDJ0362213.1 TetR family transcriptional regulator [Rhodococcus sp. H29-C3]